MSDFLLAIWADRNTCKPYTGAGRVGHVVRVTSNPHPTIINEFTDGGSFEHEDCGPASLQSWFLDATLTRTTIPEIEQLAGTNLNGTGFTGLIVAGEHFGYQVKFAPDAPLPGYVMNPGGGFIDDISTFPQYLAASQGGCLVLPNLAPIPPPEDDDLTPEQNQMLQDIHDALFKPVQQDGGEGYPAYAQPNNLDIARRAVSPYAKGYPAANPPQEP